MKICSTSKKKTKLLTAAVFYLSNMTFDEMLKNSVFSKY